MPFTTSADIINRALQHLGEPRINLTTDNAKGASEGLFAFNMLRRAELRRNLWRFAARRAALRSVTATTQILIFGTWAVGTAYSAGDIVNATDGLNYVGLRASTGKTPANGQNPTYWAQYFGPVTSDTYASGTTYYAGELVVSSAVYYVSIVNAQVGHTPASSATYWLPLSTVPTAYNLFIPGPLNITQNGTSRSIYVLPNGYLRMAPQDPKVAGTTYAGTTSGMQFSDFEVEDNFLITSVDTSQTNSAVILRFGADVTDVTKMDDMFCEGLGARLAMELCETITQEPRKFEAVMRSYDRFMAEARRVNEIEVGSTEPDEMTFRTSRLPDTWQQLGPQAPRGGQ